MMVSVDVKHWNDVIRAYHRLLEMKETYINLEALGKLVFYINKMREGRDEGLIKKMRELLGRVTSKNPTEPRIWELYATTSPVVVLKAQRLQRAYRGYTQDKWDTDPQKCQQVTQSPTVFLPKLIPHMDIFRYWKFVGSWESVR